VPRASLPLHAKKPAGREKNAHFEVKKTPMSMKKRHPYKMKTSLPDIKKSQLHQDSTLSLPQTEERHTTENYNQANNLLPLSHGDWDKF
jgi:hypothetical protein